MKKFLLLLVLLFGFASSSFAINNDFSGQWTEKISQRVVLSIYPDNMDKTYKIFISWREDNLAQKDIYRFNAKETNEGVLEYKKGEHILRNFEKNGFEDEIDYTDGSGYFKINNDELIWVDNKDKREDTVFIKADKNLISDTTVKNKFFSITLPVELKNFYKTKIKKDYILFYDKASYKEGFGGFAFGIKLYPTPSSHAMAIGCRKIGELTDKKNKLYDVVLIQPTDVQYNYTKNIPDSYSVLYNLANYILINGINGNLYYKNAGMKGEDLYSEVLNKHIRAIKEKWDSAKLEKENMSYMYNVLRTSNKKPLDKVGYAYYDANADGIDELFIGEIAKGNFKGVVYDIYTMINRTPAHVISGGARNRYYVCDDTFICNEYSSGADESGMLVYTLVENSTELYPQVGFKYDGYKNKRNPWFISYDFFNDKWDNVSKEAYFDRKKTFDTYLRFNYTPLSKFIKK